MEFRKQTGSPTESLPRGSRDAFDENSKNQLREYYEREREREKKEGFISFFRSGGFFIVIELHQMQAVTPAISPGRDRSYDRVSTRRG